MTTHVVLNRALYGLNHPGKGPYDDWTSVDHIGNCFRDRLVLRSFNDKPDALIGIFRTYNDIVADASRKPAFKARVALGLSCHLDQLADYQKQFFYMPGLRLVDAAAQGFGLTVNNPALQPNIRRKALDALYDYTQNPDFRELRGVANGQDSFQPAPHVVAVQSYDQNMWDIYTKQGAARMGGTTIIDPSDANYRPKRKVLEQLAMTAGNGGLAEDGTSDFHYSVHQGVALFLENAAETTNVPPRQDLVRTGASNLLKTARRRQY